MARSQLRMVSKSQRERGSRDPRLAPTRNTDPRVRRARVKTRRKKTPRKVKRVRREPKRRTTRRRKSQRRRTSSTTTHGLQGDENFQV